MLMLGPLNEINAVTCCQEKNRKCDVLTHITAKKYIQTDNEMMHICMQMRCVTDSKLKEA